jgi:hypothetical protein
MLLRLFSRFAIHQRCFVDDADIVIHTREKQWACSFLRLNVPLPSGVPEREGKWHAILAFNDKYSRKHAEVTPAVTIPAYLRRVLYAERPFLCPLECTQRLCLMGDKHSRQAERVFRIHGSNSVACRNAGMMAATFPLPHLTRVKHNKCRALNSNRYLQIELPSSLNFHADS